MHRHAFFTALAAGGLVLLAGGSARAVIPESAEVKAVIERGIAFLEKDKSESRLGGKCLIGLCMLKNGRQPTHPAIAEALKACADNAKGADGQDNYSTGLAIIFLCELDPQSYRDLAEVYLRALLKRQQAGGGWGYASQGPTGDTSQVQYATLGLWTANAVGIPVPQDVIERLCAYLMRTQDPSGAWGYQANDPGSYNRVKQNDIRPSLAAAGLGSLYICADLLDIHERQVKKEESNIPAALRMVESKADIAKRKRRTTKVIDSEQVLRAAADGNAWFEKNFTVKAPTYNHYYLYAFERYAAYRELSEGKIEREPEWYNQVFEYLQKTQKPDGSWASDSGTGVPVDTAFSVLCLSRSSRKSIQKIKPLGEGTLVGGMGLPKSTADLQERDGRIVESPLAGSLEEVLAIIEDPDNPQLARLAAAGEAITLDGNVTKRSGQIARLRALVSSGSYESRLVAVKTLSKVRDLDNVPILLYALTDPDRRIIREADKGLRFISRKFAGVGLSDEPTPQDLQNVQKAWKEWFLSIRPDAELLD